MIYTTVKGRSNLWKHMFLEPEQGMRNHYFAITISHIWLYMSSKLLCVVTFTVAADAADSESQHFIAI
jgi:hypothetical protein